MNNKFLTSIISFSSQKIENSYYFSIGCEISPWDAINILKLIGTKKKIIVINTCAVTESSKIISDDVCKKISLIFKEYEIFITGCGVDYEANCGRYGTQLRNCQKFDINNYNIEKTPYSNKNNVSKTLIKIQDGCNSACTYCIIPKLKQNFNYNASYDEIKEQIKQSLENRTTKIKLIGTEISKYKYEDLNLVKLLKKIIEDFPSITSIQLNAIDPASPFIFDLLDMMKRYPVLSNRLELSVQSGSNKVLKDMNRKYTKARLYEIEKHNNGSIKMSWHLIVGFPTEDEDSFNETVQTIKDLKPKNISVHPYSDRTGTAASKIKIKNSKDVIQKRIDIINQLCKCQEMNSLENIKKNIDNDFNSEKELIIDNFEKIYNLKSLDDDSFYQISNELKTVNPYQKAAVYFDYENITDDNVIYQEVNSKLLKNIFNVTLIINLNLDNQVIKSLIESEVAFSRLINILSYFNSALEITLMNVTYDNNFDKFALKILSSKIYSVQKLINKIQDKNIKKRLQILLNYKSDM